MTDKARIFCLSEIDKYKSRDAFVSELALAPIWRGDRSLQSERIETLGKLWDAYYRTVPEILTASGMSMIELSNFFHIPYTTVQSWCSKQARRYHECPVYVRLMMQEILELA